MPGARVVVFGGRGKHFCAGNELQEFLDLSPANSPGRMQTSKLRFSSRSVVRLLNTVSPRSLMSVASRFRRSMAGSGLR